MDNILAKELIDKCGVYGYTFFTLDNKEYGIRFDSSEDGYATHTIHPTNMHTMWETTPWVYAINSKFVNDQVEVIDVEVA